MPPPARLGAGGGSERWAHSRASSVSAGNGTLPVSMWNSIAPSAYTSVRASTSWPRICSGEM